MAGGRIVITITPGAGERYQGIVDLKGESLSQALETYFGQSEQLPTFISLFSSENTISGLFLQVLPGSYATDPGIAWQELTSVSHTLKGDEMLNLPNEKILKRLFPEEDIRLFDSEPINFICQCNRERMEAAILTLGKQEALEEVAKNKVLTVTCEFCNRHLDFDAVDIEKIFIDFSEKKKQR